MGGQNHVFVGELHAFHLGDHVEDRLLAQGLRVGVEADARSLLVLRETMEESVILAAHVETGQTRVVGVHDLVHTPPAGPERGEDAGRARCVQACL